MRLLKTWRKKTRPALLLQGNAQDPETEPSTSASYVDGMLVTVTKHQTSSPDPPLIMVMSWRSDCPSPFLIIQKSNGLLASLTVLLGTQWV